MYTTVYILACTVACIYYLYMNFTVECILQAYDSKILYTYELSVCWLLTFCPGCARQGLSVTLHAFHSVYNYTDTRYSNAVYMFTVLQFVDHSLAAAQH